MLTNRGGAGIIRASRDRLGDAPPTRAGRLIPRAAPAHHKERTKRMERTLIILKPDAVQRGLIGALLGRFEQRGLKIVGLRLMAVSRELAHQHYAVHEGKPFFAGLIDYITSGPVVVIAAEGPDAIAVVRSTVGATRPGAAAPGTIRADFGLTVGRNLVHASDGPETAATEIDLWFGAGALVDYTRDVDRWILE